MGAANPSFPRSTSIRALPRDAAVARRRALAAAKPVAVPVLVQRCAWIALTVTMMGGLAALFGALVGHTLH